ncbi:hypothetical protein ACS0TY_025439 [Phlomoides rotata]
MQKLLHSLIFRTINRRYFTPTSSFSTISDDALDSFKISNEVLTLINSVHPIEPALENVSPLLNREVVISVLQSQAQLEKDPRICFRFFIWVSKTASLRSGASNRLIVDMLLRGEKWNSFDLYWSVLDELRNQKLSVSADAFSVLILGYWRLKMAEKAVETFGRMNDYECKPDLAAYNVILNILVKKDVIMLALAVYSTILKSNYMLGCDTFNVLIDGLCKSQMIEDALILFDEMTSRGILPNRITYTSVMSGLCKAKKIHDAHGIFDLMVHSEIIPNSAACTTLIDGYCKNGQIDEAFMLVKSFQADGYDVGIRGFSCLIDALMKATRISEAEEQFQKVLDVGLVPDLVLYTIMLHGLCEAGRMEDAMDLFREMIVKGIVPDTQCYNVLIKGFCDSGLLDEALSLKREISRQGLLPTTCTYTILICGFCRKSLVREAQQIFKEMEKMGCNASAVTFNALIDGLCKAGELEEAQLMLCRMEIGKHPGLLLRLPQGDGSASLQKRVETLVESGSLVKAYKLLMQLADCGAVPDVRTYNILINGMCRAGQVDVARKLFEQLLIKRLSPDSVTYATLIDGFERAGRDGVAYKIFEQMNENGCKPSSSVYKTLMIWCCRKRKTSDAIAFWLKYLKSRDGFEDGALESVEEFFEKVDFESALRSLVDMDIKLADFDSAFYSIWLSGLCQVNRVEEALKTLHILEEFNVSVSAPACVILIRALCSEGELSKAVDVFLYTMQKGYRFKRALCNSVVEALLKSKNEVILALELLDRMKSVGYDLDSLLYPRTKSLLPHIYSVMKNSSAR